MKIAFVYDRVNKWGGAERVLLALHEIWPEAPLFTSVYDAGRAGWAKVFPHVIPSFLQYIPFAKNHHELFPWLTPMAFETFNFDAYDVIISVTSAEAKTIITKPHTLHVCYCLTPTRYLWSGVKEYQQSGGWMYRRLLPTLRRWDLVSASRPDYYIAISNRVAERIRKYYQRDVESVIYPPVEKFTVDSLQFTVKSNDYYLLVSRLVPYKRVDIVVEAFNKLGLPLVVIGEGWEKARLKKMARSNVTFIDRHLTDEQLALYYHKCRAFVFAGEEDFGIAAVEAQAAGKPVVAYKRSGITEIVIDGVTGILFDHQNARTLVSAIEKLKTKKIEADACKRNAERFSKNRFKKEFQTVIEKLYQQYL